MDGKTVQTNLNQCYGRNEFIVYETADRLIISGEVLHSDPVKQDNPKPYRSPLWAHLDEIQSGDWHKKPGKQSPTNSLLQYGLKISFQAVHAFFKRAIERDRRQPLGFGTESSNSIAIQTTIPVAKDSDSIYEEARQAIRAEQQSKPKIIKPDRPL